MSSVVPDPAAPLGPAAAALAAGVDALLLVSFGGPEGPDDVMPFLENVTRGRGVPPERLAEVAAHYELFGGRSPINDQNRALLAELRAALAPMPVYWGNRNWHPYLTDTLSQMAKDGVRRAACFVTSAFASYSGCRQYREDLAEALVAVGPGAPELLKLRTFFDHPGFVEPMADATERAARQLAATARDSSARDSSAGESAARDGERIHLVYVAHSIPLALAATAGPDGGAYERQFAAAAQVITDLVAVRHGRRCSHSLAYSSRSGPPSVPWLVPDVADHLADLAARGVRAVVVVPVGFVSDHMEVAYDLDVEAATRARAAGITVARAATVGTDPRFVSMVAELVGERVGAAPVRFLSEEGPSRHICPSICCLGLVRRPAAAGMPEDMDRQPAGGTPAGGMVDGSR